MQHRAPQFSCTPWMSLTDPWSILVCKSTHPGSFESRKHAAPRILIGARHMQHRAPLLSCTPWMSLTDPWSILVCKSTHPGSSLSARHAAPRILSRARHMQHRAQAFFPASVHASLRAWLAVIAGLAVRGGLSTRGRRFFFQWSQQASSASPHGWPCDAHFWPCDAHCWPCETLEQYCSVARPASRR